MRIYIGNGSHPSSLRHLWTGQYVGVGRAWGKKRVRVNPQPRHAALPCGCGEGTGSGRELFLFFGGRGLFVCLFIFGAWYFLFIRTVVVGQNIVSHWNMVALVDPSTMEQGQLWSSFFISCFECSTMNQLWLDFGFWVFFSHLSDQFISAWTIIAWVCTLYCWRCAT